MIETGIGLNAIKHFDGRAAGRFAGSLELMVRVIPGFAALHPKLYAAGRYAGLKERGQATLPDCR
jgi:hypothetical protein